jgi:WD40 repeat protein
LAVGGSFVFSKKQKLFNQLPVEVLGNVLGRIALDEQPSLACKSLFDASVSENSLSQSLPLTFPSWTPWLLPAGGLPRAQSLARLNSHWHGLRGLRVQGEPVRLDGALQALCVWPGRDGRTVVAAGGRAGVVTVFEVDGGFGSGSPPVREELLGHDTAVWDLARCVGPEGQPLLLSAGSDSTLRLWDLEAGGGEAGEEDDGLGLPSLHRVYALGLQHTSAVFCCEQLPRSGKIVSGSWDGSVKLWTAKRFELTMDGTAQVGDGVLRVLAEPLDDRLHTASMDGGLRTLDLSTMKKVDTVVLQQSLIDIVRSETAGGLILGAGKMSGLFHVDPRAGLRSVKRVPSVQCGAKLMVVNNTLLMPNNGVLQALDLRKIDGGLTGSMTLPTGAAQVQDLVQPDPSSLLFATYGGDVVKLEIAM